MNFLIALIVLTIAHYWLQRYKWYRYRYVPNSSIEASRRLVEEHGWSEEEVDFWLRRENRFRSGEWIGVFWLILALLGTALYFLSQMHN